MKSLFTIHAGEYLVGAFLEQQFKRANVWIPLRDTGVDLLVSDRRNRRTVSLQVKFSKDFLVTHMAPVFQKQLRACGWWTINREKLAQSLADYWVFVLQGFASRSTDFVVIARRELLDRLGAIHRARTIIQTYIWVTDAKNCWETRGLVRADHLQIAQGEYKNPSRDLTRWLNNWEPIARLNR
ncbi:MAG: hypothetical protein NTU53_13010 [Planctomycetota bacterium]|nr:hypothetical protein [Planctomycetota bacterium]